MIDRLIDSPWVLISLDWSSHHLFHVRKPPQISQLSYSKPNQQSIANSFNGHTHSMPCIPYLPCIHPYIINQYTKRSTITTTTTKQTHVQCSHASPNVQLYPSINSTPLLLVGFPVGVPWRVVYMGGTEGLCSLSGARDGLLAG